MLKLSLLLFFIFCYLNLYSFDQVVIKKDISLKNELSNDVLNNVQFTDSKIYVLTRFEKYIEGDLFGTKVFKISEYDYNFNIVKEYNISNIVVNDIKYQFLPIKFEVNNDTIVLTAYFVEQKQNIYKYGHNICVLKFYNSKEVFRNFETVNDSTSTHANFNNYDLLNFSINYDRIYIAYNSIKKVVREYSRNGNYISTHIIMDDSISNQLDGKIGGVFINGISVFENNIYVFFSENLNTPNLFKNYVRVYDTNFNLLKTINYIKNMSIQEIKKFSLNNRYLFIVEENLYQAQPFNDFSANHLFEIKNDSIYDLNISLGLNYPDRINDIISLSNGYMSVGMFNNIGHPVYKTTLVQKLNKSFSPIESFQLFNNENDSPNFGRFIKRINENEYIIVGENPTKDLFYFAEISNTSSIIANNNNLKLFPNPSNNFVAIEGVKYGSKFKVYNLFGQCLIEGLYNYKIDVSDLLSGTYFVEIENNIQKFVKI